MLDYEVMTRNNEAMPSVKVLKADIDNASTWEESYHIGNFIFNKDSGPADALIIDAYEKAFRTGLNIRSNKELFLKATRQIAILYFQFGKYEDVVNKLMILDSSTSNLPDWVNLYYASAQIHTDNLLYWAEKPQFFFKRIDSIDSKNETSVRRREYIFREYLNRLAVLSESEDLSIIDKGAIISKAIDLGLSETPEYYRFKYNLGLIDRIPEVDIESDKLKKKETQQIVSPDYDEIISNYKNELDAARIEADNYKLELFRREKEIEKFKRLLNKVTKELSEVTAVCNTQLKTINESKEKEYELRNRIDILKSQLKGSKEEKKQLEENSAMIGKLSAENEELKNSLSQNAEELIKLKSEVETQKRNAELFHNESIKFQEEMLKSRSAVSHLSSKYNDEKQLNKVLEEQIKALEDKHTKKITSNETEDLQVEAKTVAKTGLPKVEDFLFRNQKILVMGDSKVSVDHLIGKAKSLGFEFKKNQIEFYLDYNALDNCASRLKQYDTRYAGVIVGPCPHLLKNTDGYSSFIQKLKVEDGYPHVEEARDNSGTLKLTKESFGEAISRMAVYLSSIS